MSLAPPLAIKALSKLPVISTISEAMVNELIAIIKKPSSNFDTACLCLEIIGKITVAEGNNCGDKIPTLKAKIPSK